MLFGLLINRMAALAAAFGDLTMGGEDAIHCADPTKVDAFIAQRRIDFGGCLVGKPRGPQLSQAPDFVPFPAKHALTEIGRASCRERVLASV